MRLRVGRLEGQEMGAMGQSKGVGAMGLEHLLRRYLPRIRQSKNT